MELSADKSAGISEVVIVLVFSYSDADEKYKVCKASYNKRGCHVPKLVSVVAGGFKSVAYEMEAAMDAYVKGYLLWQQKVKRVDVAVVGDPLWTVVCDVE